MTRHDTKLAKRAAEKQAEIRRLLLRAAIGLRMYRLSSRRELEGTRQLIDDIERVV